MLRSRGSERIRKKGPKKKIRLLSVVKGVSQSFVVRSVSGWKTSQKC